LKGTRPRRLLPDAPQHRHKNTHQDSNNCNDHQQLYECETVSLIHNGYLNTNISLPNPTFHQIINGEVCLVLLIGTCYIIRNITRNTRRDFLLRYFSFYH
jgi:hypothetical protein